MSDHKKPNRGQGMIEYILILVLVAIVILVIIALFQPTISELVSRFLGGGG